MTLSKNKFIVLLWLVLVVLQSKTNGQNISESSIRGGFVVPEFDAKNRKRSVLYGDEAQFLSNRTYLIKGLKIEVFNDDEKVIWTVNAPHCYFNYNNRTAFSDGELKLNSEDGQLSMYGSGFEWRQSDSSLTISNNILTRVRVLSRATNAPRGTVRQEFEITSKKFQFRARTFEAEYSGNVHVKETPVPRRKANLMNLSCDDLLVKFLEKLGGVQEIVAKNNVIFDDAQSKVSARRAIYTATNNVVVLEGPASWSTSEAEGIASTIILNRQQEEFIAYGKTITKSKSNIGFGIHSMFPSPKSTEQNGISSDNPVEISAEKITATKSIIRGVEMRSFNAETNVVVTQGKNFITSDKLLFSYTTNDASLHCQGNIQWKTPGMSGKAEELTYSKKINSMVANGSVETKLELHSFQSKEPQIVNTNKRIVEIHGESFSYQLTNISLKGNVKLIDEFFEINCDNLNLSIKPPDTIEKFIAKDNVKLKQKSRNKNYWILTSKYLDGESDKTGSGIEKIRVYVDVNATYNANLTNEVNFEKLRLNCYEACFLLNPLSNNVKTIKMSNDIVVVQNRLQSNLVVTPDFKLKCDSLTIEMDENGDFIKSGTARGQVVLEKKLSKTEITGLPIILKTESLKMCMQPNTNLVDYLESDRMVLIEYGGNYAVANKAIYYGTNELIELRGNPGLNLSPETINSMSGKHTSAVARTATQETVVSKKTKSDTPGLKTINVTGAETLLWSIRDNRFEAIGPYKLNISLSSTNAQKSGFLFFKK